MPSQNKINKTNSVKLIILLVLVAFVLNPIVGIIFIIAAGISLKRNPKFLNSHLPNYREIMTTLGNKLDETNPSIFNFNTQNIFSVKKQSTRLEKRKKYLHIALNSTLEEAQSIISQLPNSDRILIEVGTPLIKIYGTEAISEIKDMAPPGTYIVADNKCADLAAREVEMMANAGANAATCLGVAPIETIDSFVEECLRFSIDSILDMMNVEDALSVLKKLKTLPNVVMLHRGVDETEFSKEKQIPLYQIKQIKGSYNVLVAVAGGDTIKDIQRAIFNDADIVVVWKNFYRSSSETVLLAESFLKEIK